MAAQRLGARRCAARLTPDSAARGLAIVTWSEENYYHKRKQGVLGKLTPVQFEATMIGYFALAA